MKHTYIFEVADGVTEGDLYRLEFALKCSTVSYKTSHSHCRYDRIQVFAFPGEMHRIAHAAGFSGEQLRVALPAARRRGDTAVQKASDALRNRTLDAIDRKRAEAKNLVLEPKSSFRRPNDTEMLDWLEANKALLNSPNTGRGAHVALSISEHYYDGTYRDVIARAMRGTPPRPAQMPGGTKRSKRSA